jgi:hypothetical protein
VGGAIGKRSGKLEINSVLKNINYCIRVVFKKLEAD